MGHWHLNSRDIEANKKIFLAMGGTEGAPGPLQRVIFPGVMVILNLGAGGAAGNGGTAGSVVNHVGFVVKNVQESVAKWKAAGVPVEPGGNNRLDQAWVITPDGLRVEILEDKNQSMPIRHEHVHFFLPEAAIPQSQAWYGKIFEAKAGHAQQRAGRRPARHPAALQQDRCGGSAHQGPHPRPYRLRRDRPEGLHEEARSGRHQAGPALHQERETGLALAFITDPFGTYIELNERPNPVYLH